MKPKQVLQLGDSVKSSKNKILLLFLISLTGEARAITVSTLTITNTGIAGKSLTAQMDRDACKAFKPTKNQIVTFFNHATPVSSTVLLDKRFSDCLAVGSVTLRDGSTGEWVLYSSGMARLKYPQGQSIYLLYKQNKWNDPYACSYGRNGEEC